MRWHILIWLVCIGSVPVTSFCQNTIQIKYSKLADNYEEVKLGNQALINAKAQLVEMADSIRKINYWPRVTNKKLTSVSKDIHDYVSMATYYWADPNARSAAAYVGRDGRANPEVATINNYENLVKVCQWVEILGLAYFYTKDDKYVTSAFSLLNVFFLRKDTRMNPNFKHAQFVKGKNRGRLVGIVESRFFVGLLDGVQLMKDSKKFDLSYYNQLKDWFGQFLDWMESSSVEASSKSLKNNIETCYYMQRIAYCLFLGQKDKIAKIYKNNLQSLLRRQIRVNGAQPLELKREKPIQYSIANVDYWVRITNMLSNAGIKISMEDSAKLSNALNYILTMNIRNVNAYHAVMLEGIYSTLNNGKTGMDEHDYVNEVFDRTPNGYIRKLIFILTH